MTPKAKAIAILKAVIRNDAAKARAAFAGMSPEEMQQELYGGSKWTRQEILDVYERQEAEHLAAIKWAEGAPE